MKDNSEFRFSLDETFSKFSLLVILCAYGHKFNLFYTCMCT